MKLRFAAAISRASRGAAGVAGCSGFTLQFTLYSTINYPVRHLLRTHFYFSPAPGSWTLSTGRRRLDVDVEAAGQMITKQGARYTSTILW